MRRLLPLTSSWEDDDYRGQQHDSAPGMAACLMQPWSGWGSSLSALLGCVMPREKPGSGGSAGEERGAHDAEAISPRSQPPGAAGVPQLGSVSRWCATAVNTYITGEASSS